MRSAGRKAVRVVRGSSWPVTTRWCLRAPSCGSVAGCVPTPGHLHLPYVTQDATCLPHHSPVIPRTRASHGEGPQARTSRCWIKCSAEWRGPSWTTSLDSRAICTDCSTDRMWRASPLYKVQVQRTINQPAAQRRARERHSLRLQPSLWGTQTQAIINFCILVFTGLGFEIGGL